MRRDDQTVRRREPRTIGEAIRAHADSHGKYPAIVASGFEALSYQELRNQIDEIGSRLRQAGFDQNARIVVALENSPEAALAIVAVACVATAVPLDPKLTVAEVEKHFTLVRPNAVLLPRGRRSAARNSAEQQSLTIIDVIVANDGQLRLQFIVPQVDAAARLDDPDPDTPAFILQTSGTIAGPKLIPYSHNNMLTAAARLQVWYDLTPLDRCLAAGPVWYAHALRLTVFTPLLAGGSVAFPSNALKVDLSEWLGALMPTWYSAGPTLHLSILEQMESQPTAKSIHSLRFIVSSGASLPDEVHNRLQSVFGVPVLEQYGSSETSAISTNRPPPSPSKPRTCGIPWPDTVIIIGEDGRRLVPGALGEILVGGPTVTSGYLNAPELNRVSFVDGWYKTGDIGTLDEDGFLTLHGRKDDLINRGGEKISPVEIDDALVRHPAIAEAAAFAVPHPRLGEDVAAAIVLRTGMTATPVELRGYLQEQLASFKVPRRIVIRDHLPKGQTGKVLRRQLTESLAEKAAAETQAEAPRSIDDASVDSDLVVQLAEIWERLLKVAPLSLNDDFFENGGDSLLAMEMLVELERFAGRSIPTSILFDAPTIGELARKLADRDYLNQKSKALIRLNSSGDQAPLFYFHGDFERSGYYAAKLAKLLGSDQPLFVVAPHGLGDESVPRSIEAMAADRLPLILDAQPSGPYRLCGYCNAAIVAFEVARMLIAVGEKVEMVGMIDPPPVNARGSALTLFSTIGLALPVAGPLVEGAMTSAWYQFARLRRFSYWPLAQQWAAIKRKVQNLVAGGIERTPWEQTLATFTNYFPKPLAVRVIYFSAEHGAEAWAHICPDLEVIKLPSDHFMVLIDPTDLAEHLKIRLQADS
jgi:acyl-CoA synthetase (AMP-forming)/AMP-acid ligase II/thioesterase domain-containing protein